MLATPHRVEKAAQTISAEPEAEEKVGCVAADNLSWLDHATLPDHRGADATGPTCPLFVGLHSYVGTYLGLVLEDTC